VARDGNEDRSRCRKGRCEQQANHREARQQRCNLRHRDTHTHTLTHTHTQTHTRTDTYTRTHTVLEEQAKIHTTHTPAPARDITHAVAQHCIDGSTSEPSRKGGGSKESRKDKSRTAHFNSVASATVSESASGSLEPPCNNSGQLLQEAIREGIEVVGSTLHLTAGLTGSGKDSKSGNHDDDAKRAVTGRPGEGSRGGAKVGHSGRGQRGGYQSGGPSGRGAAIAGGGGDPRQMFGWSPSSESYAAVMQAAAHSTQTTFEDDGSKKVDPRQGCESAT